MAELKRMLEKAEAEIDIQKCKVKTLESIIVSLGGKIPRDDDIMKQMEEERKALEELEAQKAAAESDEVPSDSTLQPDSFFSDSFAEEQKEAPLEQPLMSFQDQELLQEKMDEIELLKSMLEKEKEKLHNYERMVANMTEELSIMTQKCTQYKSEHEADQRKLKDCINRMQTFREDIQDKDEKIE